MFLLQNAELSPWNEYFRLLRLSALQANRRQTKRGKSAYPRKSHSIPAICHDSRESTTCRRISCRRHVPFRSAKIANTGLKHILISETMGKNCRSSSICPATKIKRHSYSTVDTENRHKVQTHIKVSPYVWRILWYGTLKSTLVTNSNVFIRNRPSNQTGYLPSHSSFVCSKQHVCAGPAGSAAYK